MKNVLFVHHSIGRQLLDDGGLRSRLANAERSVALWDHDYNEIGLTDPDGNRLGTAFPVPQDDTDPPGLLTLLQALLEGRITTPKHDLLVLKSCFPNNAIASDGDLDQIRQTYTVLREIASELPASVLLVSSPPLVFEATTREQARRATQLTRWLAEFWPGPGLGFVDLFRALSYGSGPFPGTLALRYRALRRGDSHLRPSGARAGAELLATAILSSV